MSSVASAVQKLNVGQIFFIAALGGLLAFFHKSPFVKQRRVTFCVSFYDRRTFLQTIDTSCIFFNFPKKAITCVIQWAMDSNSVLSCSDAEEITVIAEPSQTGLAKKSVFSTFYLGLRPFKCFLSLLSAVQRPSTLPRMSLLELQRCKDTVSCIGAQSWVPKRLPKHRKWCHTYSNKNIIRTSTMMLII